MLKRAAIAFAVAAMFASQGHAADTYVTNAADIVKAADWKQMKTVEVVIGEHHYAPEVLKLAVNQPTRVVLVNKSDKAHYWTAPDFFRAVATRKVQTAEAEVKAPYFSALEVYKGGTVEFFFVPVNKGSFDVYCTIEDHREKGMEGKIVVE
jgi:uncharacterized cupredoxin-like copper-binding protein